MVTRNHHHLSQCYLKGFSNGGSKKSRITVIDLKQKKIFETIPRNIGAIRDFNLIEIKGVDPNIIENDYARFESKVAPALRNVEESLLFEGENRNLILNFIALLAMRSPENREMWRGFYEKTSECIMELSLATKERWDSSIKQMKEKGQKIDGSIDYEKMKEFFEKKEYRIEVPRERHIIMEQTGIATILPLLAARDWFLLKSTKESGPFVTSDHPVVLDWKEPEKIPPFYRNSPGYGLKETRLYFPISQKIALVGEFEGRSGVGETPKNLVSVLNSILIAHSYKQIYSPKIGFYFWSQSGEIIEGNKILDHLS